MVNNPIDYRGHSPGTAWRWIVGPLEDVEVHPSASHDSEFAVRQFITHLGILCDIHGISLQIKRRTIPPSHSLLPQRPRPSCDTHHEPSGKIEHS
jgi:hypothetical protein